MQKHPAELAANWLEQAVRDLESARVLGAGKRFEAACFACQQSVEKALKAALIWLVGDRQRTHEIGILVAELAAHRDDARAELGDVDALDPYYLTTRYPDAVGGGIPGTKFYEPEATLALERAARAIGYVRRILPAV